jgi:hypothetical protein
VRQWSSSHRSSSRRVGSKLRPNDRSRHAVAGARRAAGSYEIHWSAQLSLWWRAAAPSHASNMSGERERHDDGTRLVDSIRLIRGQRVSLDSVLADLYGVTTRRLNEQVRRNRHRFPSDFLFELNATELANLKSHFATSSWGGSPEAAVRLYGAWGDHGCHHPE